MTDISINLSIDVIQDTDLEVERSGSLPDSAAGVVMAAVAGAVVTSELSGVGDGDAAEVSAHAEDHQPLGVLDTLSVRLGIPQGIGVNGHLGLNLRGGPVSDEQGLASPLKGHVLTCNHNMYAYVKLEKLLRSMFSPSGMSPSLISIFARANTSWEADHELMN